MDMANSATRQRNPLLPWWIGLAIVIASEIYVGYRLFCLDCGPIGGLLGFMVLGVVPVVYLTLMYLTLKSQADSERQ
jgi:hypothetical protein